jgi:hypothetical protein
MTEFRFRPCFFLLVPAGTGTVKSSQPELTGRNWVPVHPYILCLTLGCWWMVIQWLAVIRIWFPRPWGKSVSTLTIERFGLDFHYCCWVYLWLVNWGRLNKYYWLMVAKVKFEPQSSDKSKHYRLSRYSSLFYACRNTGSTKDGPLYWTSRKNSSELTELSNINGIDHPF